MHRIELIDLARVKEARANAIPICHLFFDAAKGGSARLYRLCS